MVTLDLFLTPEDECSYLPDRRSRSLFIDPTAALNPHMYTHLMAAGFRRSGSQVYTTRCDNCAACIPLRLPVNLFKPNRSQRRTLRSNHDLDTHLVDEISDEHLQLYRKYMESRHPDSPMAQYGLEECRQFMLSEWCDTQLLEFRLGRKLLAVAATDRLADCLSAVYTCFDPDHERRGLGVHAILSQIELARQLKLDWLYLGFWIPDCAKMSYKANYLPLQLRIDGEWRFFAAKSAIQLLSN